MQLGKSLQSFRAVFSSNKQKIFRDQTLLAGFNNIHSKISAIWSVLVFSSNFEFNFILVCFFKKTQIECTLRASRFLKNTLVQVNFKLNSKSWCYYYCHAKLWKVLKEDRENFSNIECPFTRLFNIHNNQIRNGFILLNNELDPRVRTKQESWKRTDKVL